MTQAPFPGPENAPSHQKRISEEPFESRKKQGSVWKYLGIGCLAIIVISLIVAIIGGIVIYKNARTWGADLVNNASKEVINKSQLPADQKQRMIARIESLSQDFKDGKLTVEQLALIAERIAQSPMLNMGMVYFFEQQIVAPSGLTSDEKVDARRTLERVARGVFEKSITQVEMDALTSPLMETGVNGKKQLKKKVTDAELREFLVKAKAQVEVAQIPDEPFRVNMAEELDKVIEEVRSGKSLPEKPSREAIENELPANAPAVPVAPALPDQN